jgi:hypothetical protein
MFIITTCIIYMNIDRRCRSVSRSQRLEELVLGSKRNNDTVCCCAFRSADTTVQITGRQLRRQGNMFIQSIHQKVIYHTVP